MKNRIIGMLLVIVMSVCVFAGCGNTSTPGTGKGEEKSSDKKLNIVTTFYAPYDFAKQVTGDKADITMLLKPGAESHSYEPSPQDILKIQNCDVFIYAGGENDTWVDKVLASVDNKNMKVIKLLDCVDAVEEELTEGMEADEDDDAKDEDSKDSKDSKEEKEWDEHVWTSPVNVVKISTQMEKTFSEVDKTNEGTYKANLEAYVTKLNELDKQFKEVVSSAKRNTVVFGDRFPLRYFVEEYGLKYFAAFPGCSGSTEASAATVAFLTDKVKNEKLPVVFKIELSNGNIAKSIADATGAKVLTFYSCHNVSNEDFKAGLTYIDFMKKNVETLKEALN